MKKMKCRVFVLLMVMCSCIWTADAHAYNGGMQTAYTVKYIARDGETERLLAEETLYGPAGRTGNVCSGV